jgi:hypothetical protein
MGGRDGPEWLGTMDRNQWARWTGIPSVQTDEGFVLKKGSSAAKSNTDSLSTKLVKLKDQLIEDGRLGAEVDHLLLSEDILMSSSSYAAALIAGTARSGPQSWVHSSGKSLKELDDLAAKKAETESSTMDA